MLFGDQEPAIKALQEEVRVKRDDETVCLNSPVESSASNGNVARAIQDVEGSIRAIKSSREDGIGGRIMVTDDIFPWLVAHAADCTNRYKPRKDCRTAREKTSGRTDCPKIAEFGGRCTTCRRHEKEVRR